MKAIVCLILTNMILLSLLFHAYWKLDACTDTLEQIKQSNNIIHQNFIGDTTDGYKQLNDYMSILQSAPESAERTAFFKLVAMSMQDDELSKSERVLIRMAFIAAQQASPQSV